MISPTLASIAPLLGPVTQPEKSSRKKASGGGSGFMAEA